MNRSHIFNFYNYFFVPQNNFLHKFNDLGSFSYYCELHPWMIGIISVSNSEVPSWIKHNAGWWAEGTIDDDSFVQGIEYLVNVGIIQVT